MSIEDDYLQELKNHNKAIEKHTKDLIKHTAAIYANIAFYDGLDKILDTIDERDRAGMASDFELEIFDEILEVMEQSKIEEEFYLIQSNFEKIIDKQ